MSAAVAAAATALADATPRWVMVSATGAGASSLSRHGRTGTRDGHAPQGLTFAHPLAEVLSRGESLEANARTRGRPFAPQGSEATHHLEERAPRTPEMIIHTHPG